MACLAARSISPLNVLSAILHHTRLRPRPSFNISRFRPSQRAETAQSALKCLQHTHTTSQPSFLSLFALRYLESWIRHQEYVPSLRRLFMLLPHVPPHCLQRLGRVRQGLQHLHQKFLRVTAAGCKSLVILWNRLRCTIICCTALWKEAMRRRLTNFMGLLNRAMGDPTCLSQGRSDPYRLLWDHFCGSRHRGLGLRDPTPFGLQDIQRGIWLHRSPRAGLGLGGWMSADATERVGWLPRAGDAQFAPRVAVQLSVMSRILDQRGSSSFTM